MQKPITIKRHSVLIKHKLHNSIITQDDQRHTICLLLLTIILLFIIIFFYLACLYGQGFPTLLLMEELKVLKRLYMFARNCEKWRHS